MDYIYVYEEKKGILINQALQKMQKEGDKEVDRFIQPTKSPRKKISIFKNVCNPMADDYAGIDLTKTHTAEDESESGKIV